MEGVKDPGSLVKALWDGLHNPDKVSANVLFERHVRVEEAEGRRVVVVDVPRADRRDRPVHIGRDVFRGTYRRNGEGDYRCPRESVLAMLRDQGSETADGLVVESMTAGELDAGTVRRYRGLFANLKPGHAWNALPDEEFLLKIGAAARTRDGAVRPNLAGLVCFGEYVRILDALPDYFLDYRERGGGGTRWDDRVCSADATWSGNVLDFFFRVHPRLTADLKVPFAMSGALTRVDDTPMHKALREALANALVHADYYGRRGIVVEKEFRRVRISNPGGLRMSAEIARAGGTSDARNARIFNIFALVDIGERSGTGLCNILDVWRRAGYPEPTLDVSFEPDRVTFGAEFERAGSEKRRGVDGERGNWNACGETLKSDLEWTVNDPENHQSDPEKLKTGLENKKTDLENSGMPLGNDQSDLDSVGSGAESPGPTRKTLRRIDVEKLFDTLKGDGTMTYEALSGALNVSEASVKRGIRKLKEAGRIRRVGTDRKGYWEVPDGEGVRSQE